MSADLRAILVLTKEAAVDPVLKPECHAATPVEAPAHSEAGAIAEVENPEVPALRMEALRLAIAQCREQVGEQHRRLANRVDTDPWQWVALQGDAVARAMDARIGRRPQVSVDDHRAVRIDREVELPEDGRRVQTRGIDEEIECLRRSPGGDSPAGLDSLDPRIAAKSDAAPRQRRFDLPGSAAGKLREDFIAGGEHHDFRSRPLSLGKLFNVRGNFACRGPAAGDHHAGLLLRSYGEALLKRAPQVPEPADGLHREQAGIGGVRSGDRRRLAADGDRERIVRDRRPLFQDDPPRASIETDGAIEQETATTALREGGYIDLVQLGRVEAAQHAGGKAGVPEQVGCYDNQLVTACCEGCCALDRVEMRVARTKQHNPLRQAADPLRLDGGARLARARGAALRPDADEVAA